jgi:hypothetical protein
VTVLEREKEAQDTEETLEKKRLEEEERRKQSHDMVAESIRRELAESKPSKNARATVIYGISQGRKKKRLQILMTQMAWIPTVNSKLGDYVSSVV